MDALDYERQGFIKGAMARMVGSNQKVILVSNPKIDLTDYKIKIWAAMEFDTHVRYLAVVDELELI